MAKIFVIFLLFCSFGCKSKLKEPELVDPIYADLKKEIVINEEKLQEVVEELESVKDYMSKTQPRSFVKVQARKRYFAIKKEIKRIKQQITYLNLRVLSRKLYARQKYREAFKKDLEWPNRQEFESYKTNKRLRSINLDWDSRLPGSEEN